MGTKLKKTIITVSICLLILPTVAATPTIDEILGENCKGNSINMDGGYYSCTGLYTKDSVGYRMCIGQYERQTDGTERCTHWT